jgi:hypothetical protein
MTDNYDNWHDPNDDDFSNKHERPDNRDRPDDSEHRNKDLGDRPEDRGGHRDK